MFDLKAIPAHIRNSLSDTDFRLFTQDAIDDEPARLQIMDSVGEMFGGIGAGEVADFLHRNSGKQVNVQINSPGGLAFDGLSIYNDLHNHDADVEVTISGLAFSAASVIAMAGTRVRMHEASDFGIHRSGIIAMGNRKQLAAAIEWLDVLDQHLVDVYHGRTGADRDEIENWLDGTDDGTLWSAKQAVELGFADEVIPAKKRAKNAADRQVAKATNRIKAEHNAMLARMKEKKQLTV